LELKDRYQLRPLDSSTTGAAQTSMHAACVIANVVERNMRGSPLGATQRTLVKA
jgi:hypothetical protein